MHLLIQDVIKQITGGLLQFCISLIQASSEIKQPTFNYSNSCQVNTYLTHIDEALGSLSAQAFLFFMFNPSKQDSENILQKSRIGSNAIRRH